MKKFHTMLAKILLVYSFCTLLACGCTKSTPAADVQEPIVMNDKSLKLVKAGNNFSFQLLGKALDGTAENRMVSPFSVSTALSMTLNGASGPTLAAMQKALGLESLTRDEINTIYQNLSTALVKADPAVAMKIANSVWIRKDFSVLTPFIETNKTYYNAQVTKLDFNAAALSTINQWVSDNTAGKIPTILSSISDNEVMFLINAIYFNGKWKYQFETAKTASEPFTCTNKQVVSVPMMKMENYFGYAVKTGYKALKMPYSNGKFGMVLLLPDAGTTPDKLAASLNATAWENLRNDLANEKKVPVWIPKFKFAWEKNLNEILTSLGMGVAFDASTADFSGINKDVKLFISRVIHKTYIDVSESGTEAAAVTSIGVGVTSIPTDPPTFYLTRPFLFFIMEEDTGAILFSGKVENPLLSN